jgi:hypothetical protein
MASELVAGVIGAGVGAILTAGGTWRVSVSLDRKHARRELAGAVNVVRAELAENADRLRNGGHPGALTHGDWARGKVILSGLPDQALWHELRRTYQKIFELSSGRPDPTPATPLTHAHLDGLDANLESARTAL